MSKMLEKYQRLDELAKIRDERLAKIRQYHINLEKKAKKKWKMINKMSC